MLTEPADWREWRPSQSGPRVEPAQIRPTRSDGLDGSSLVKYVLAARVDLLAERTVGPDLRWAPTRRPAPLNRSKMATSLGLASATLSERLGHKHEPRLAEVIDLEHRLTAFAHRERGMTSATVRELGWIAAFATEMLPEQRTDKHTANLGRWLRDFASLGPTNSAQALVLGEALLDLLSGGTPETAAAIWDQSADAAMLAARSLVAVATRPPGGGAMAAVHLGAELGGRILPVVEQHVMASPVGFRAMRFVQRIFEIAHTRPPSWWSSGAEHEIADARALLRRVDAATATLPDPNPSRSLFLEAVRASLSTGRDLVEQDWRAEAVGMIRRRFESDSRPNRERAYAALCLWELDELSPDAVAHVDPVSRSGWREFLAALLRACPPGSLAEFMLNDAWMRQLHRPEIELVADCLARAGASAPGSEGGSDGGTRRRPEGRGSADTRAGSLGFLARLPVSVQAATGQLVRVALLSPDGNARGRACEALREALVTDEVVGIITAVISAPDVVDWLREIGAFVLGQLGDPSAAPVLTLIAGDPTISVSSRHAAFWALGDLRLNAGTTAPLLVAERAITAALAGDGPPESPGQPSVLAAATYAVAVLDRHGSKRAILELLANPYVRTAGGRPIDPVVAELARWGLATAERSGRRDAAPEERMVWGAGPDDLPLRNALRRP